MVCFFFQKKGATLIGEQPYDGSLSASWSIDCDAERIEFVLSANSDIGGWFAVGLGARRDMTGADMLLVRVDGANVAEIRDTHATSNAAPTMDEQQVSSFLKCYFKKSKSKSIVN